MQSPRTSRVDFLDVRLDAARYDETTGFLTASARLTRTGVFVYEDAEGQRWGELRDADEVFDQASMASFGGVVVTNEHPQGFVTTRNVREVQVGHVGTDVRRDGDYLVATVTITDPATIDAIRAGKVEVSCGYTAEIVAAQGTYDGQTYTARQTKIRGNHLAVVEEGRAGPGARLLLDAAHTVRQDRENTMVTEKKDAMVAVGDREFEVPEEVANMMAALQADLADAREALAKMASESESGSESEDMGDKMRDGEMAKDGVSELRAKLDAVKAELDQAKAAEASRIDARVRLVSDAQRVLGNDYAYAGKSDAEIQSAVVLHVLPTMADRLEANRGDAGYLRAAYERALDTHADTERHVSDSLRTIHDAVASRGGGESLDTDYKNFMDRRTGGGSK